jgi:protein PhnA
MRSPTRSNWASPPVITVLKRGTVIKNIHLTDNEIEGRADEVKDLVLRTEFLEKA